MINSPKVMFLICFWTVYDDKSSKRSLGILGPEGKQKDLQTATGLTRRGVEWNLKMLKAHGQLRRVGSPRGGHWEVINPSSN